MSNPEITYYELTPANFEGLGWRDMERESPFDRLPKTVNHLPHVASQMHTTCGICCFFNTNSTVFRIKMEHASDHIGEPQFNVCAFSGVDLYMYDDNTVRWRWAGTYTDHQCIQNRHPEYTILEGIPKADRRCRLYLPMRNQLLKIWIGLEAGASFELLPPREDNKLVYYGTSIIHGAYSTRSGLGIAQILARNLDMPLMNLGLSGGCRLDMEIAELLVKLQGVKVLVVDPMHNMWPDIIRQNMPAFLDYVCPKMPDTEIVFVTSPRHIQGWLRPELEARQLEMQRLFHYFCAERMPKYKNLHFIDGQDFYGTDEVSPDGVHPNDNAGWHMANELTRIISDILRRRSQLKA